MHAKYFLYPALVLLVSCGSDEPPATEATASEEQAEKPGGVIPEYQLKALEKARQVEGQMQESLEERAEEADDL
jgi:hypothetical protein